MAMVMLELSIYMEKVGELESYVQKFLSFKICCNWLDLYNSTATEDQPLILTIEGHRQYRHVTLYYLHSSVLF